MPIIETKEPQVLGLWLALSISQETSLSYRIITCHGPLSQNKTILSFIAFEYSHLSSLTGDVTSPVSDEGRLYSKAVVAGFSSRHLQGGDPKTLTPGPWTPLRTGSTDCLTDRSTGYPYGPPIRNTLKQHTNENKYLLLTEFEVRTVSYGKKRGSVTYSTDRENEVSKIFMISLRLTGARARKLVKVKRKVQLPQRMPCQNPKN